MKQILCVVDLTDSTERVLDVSAMIAMGCQARLRILYPYRLISLEDDGDMTAIRQKLESAARKRFQEISKNIPALSSVSHEFLPEIGFVSDRINAYIRRNCVEMIIIGQEQSDDKRNFDLQDFIRQTQLPFIIIPTAVRATASV